MENAAIRVLIVEDEWEYSDSIKDVLEERGFFVEDSVTGEEALELLSKKEYDIILLDIKLPDMSGIELLKKINKIAPDSICIMMTAFASIESSIEALTLGAFAYLYKPVNMDELLIYLRNAYHRRRVVMQHKRNADILDYLNTAVVATDKAGNIIYWNNGAEKIFGWNFNEIFGANLKIIFPNSDDGEDTSIQDFTAGITDKTKVVRLKKKNGIMVTCCMKISQMDKLEELTANIVWTFMDLDKKQVSFEGKKIITYSIPGR